MHIYIPMYVTCKSGGYLPVSGGQLALVMAEVTTTNHCGQTTDIHHTYIPGMVDADFSFSSVDESHSSKVVDWSA